MNTTISRLLPGLIILTAMLEACGSLRPGYETPTVTISSFRTVPSQGTLPTFEIGLNVINPVAAYITAGFDQYGDRFSDVLNEEWGDTQVQLTAALTLYESVKQRRDAGEFDKQLFLDMEEVWQLLVKTGVAGVRTKSMVDSESKRITGT